MRQSGSATTDNETSDLEYKNSLKATAALTSAIFNQADSFMVDSVAQAKIMTDALRLRYAKPLTNIPRNCACGKANSIDHALSCKKGGFVSLRHNQVRDLEAGMLNEVCRDVKVEPHLTPLTGEQFFHKTANTSSEARLDIAARGLWNTMDKTFFDVRVFHHECPSNKNLDIAAAYKKHEGEKKRGYNARVLNVEKATFTPLVFSTHGGMGQEAEAFHKRLATLIAKKEVNSIVMLCRLCVGDFAFVSFVHV